jgi:hypothetical protein
MNQGKAGLKNAVLFRQKLLPQSSMGGKGSKLPGFSSGITGTELDKNSKEIRELSDALFQFMYSNSNEKDMLDIANNPEKYVIAVSDLITTQFAVLGYKTRSGQMGEIYFRKFNELEPPLPSERDIEVADAKDQRYLTEIRNTGESRRYKKEIEERGKTRRRRQKGYARHKENSEIIAFYFVRLFQILGALLLVVKDINIPEYDETTGEIRSSRTDKYDTSYRDYAKQAYPDHYTLRSFKGTNIPINRARLEMLEARERERERLAAAPSENPQDGGGNFRTDKPLGPFEFLRYYIRIPNSSDTELYAKNRVNTRLEPDRTFLFDKAKLLVFRFTPPQNPSGIDASAANGGIQELGIPASDSSNEQYEVKFIKIQIKSIMFETEQDSAATRLQEYSTPSSRKSGRKDEIYASRIKLYFPEITGGNNTLTLQRAQFNPTSSMSNGLEYIVSSTEPDNLLEVLKSDGLNPKGNFAEILEKITQIYLRKKYSNITFLKFKSNEGSSEEDDKRVPEGFLHKLPSVKNKSINDVLTVLNSSSQLYQPHCISRALQLLDPASINNFTSGTAISNICKYSIGKKKELTKLSEHIGIRSLGQLYGKINPADYEKSMDVLKAFVQKDSQGDPMSVSGVSNTPGESESLLNAITRLTKAFNITYNKETHKSFTDIALDRSKECGTKRDAIELQRGNAVFNEMKAYSQKLLETHFNKIVEISTFLKKIFNISRNPDGSPKVEGPKMELLLAGFGTLDTLTNQARELLLNYYSGCEEIYQSGVKAWEAGEIKKRGAAAGATGAAGPGAAGAAAAAAENNPSNPNSSRVNSGAANPGPPQGGGRRLI